MKFAYGIIDLIEDEKIGHYVCCLFGIIYLYLISIFFSWLNNIAGQFFGSNITYDYI